MRAGAHGMGRSAVLVVAGLLAIASACGDDDAPTDAPTDESTPSTSASTDAALTRFAAEADDVCRRHLPRFEALDDPDGDGGQKPLGLGREVESLFTELGTVRPPAPYAAAWDEAIALLVESGELLVQAEARAAAGDTAAAGELQSEALFDRQPRAHELIDPLGAPFEACFT